MTLRAGVRRWITVATLACRQGGPPFRLGVDGPGVEARMEHTPKAAHRMACASNAADLAWVTTGG